MKKSKKKIILVVLSGVLILGVIGFYSFPLLKPKEIPVSKEEVENFVQKRGEEGLKRKIALTQVAVYEKMLVQFPESADLKKKLASAYKDAGEHDKAQKLLESLPK